ncbi:YebC/PmpR family DNA-binding transcriptional regulator, partial [Candidatus Peregrinibacteria bacterium]|nr:YebC/PmpR family DNA-binding transcriptional regulator [Candidatus Peregrinibacteria bacterium]
AEDFEISEERVYIQTAFENLAAVRDYLLGKGYKLENIRKDKISETKAALEDEGSKEKFLQLLEKLEADEDVSEIFHNAEF